MTACPWCAGTGPDEPDPAVLCRRHEAEYCGTSETGLDRRDSEQDAEYAEWVAGR